MARRSRDASKTASTFTLPSGMTRNGNTFYAVKAVPKDLRRVLGKTQFKQTLGTTDIVEAKRRLHAALASFQLVIDSAENPNAALMQEAMQRRSFIRAAATQTHDDDLHEDERQDHLDQRELEIEDVKDRAREIGGTAGKRYLAVALGSGAPIRELIEPWLADEKGIKEQTKAQHRKAVNELLAFLGHKEALTSDVSWQMAAGFREQHLLGALQLTEKTAKRYQSSLSSFWQWLARTRRIGSQDDNPKQLNIWTGLSPSKRKSAAKESIKRTGWSDEEITLILTSPHTGPLLRSLVLLAMFTGARIEELCALQATDVKVDAESDRQYFEIRASKTESGVRKVPIHQAIQPLVASLVAVAESQSDEGWLFPTLVAGGTAKDKRSHSVSKAFGRLTRGKLKLAGKEKVFHSFRNNVVTTLEQTHPDKIAIQRVVGHKPEGVTFGVYSGGLKIKQLAQVVDSIAYGDDLQALAAKLAAEPLSSWSTAKKASARRNPAKPKGRPRRRREALAEPT